MELITSRSCVFDTLLVLWLSQSLLAECFLMSLSTREPS